MRTLNIRSQHQAVTYPGTNAPICQEHLSSAIGTKYCLQEQCLFNINTEGSLDPQGYSLRGKVVGNFQCKNIKVFLKHAFPACDYLNFV